MDEALETPNFDKIFAVGGRPRAYNSSLLFANSAGKLYQEDPELVKTGKMSMKEMTAFASDQQNKMRQELIKVGATDLNTTPLKPIQPGGTSGREINRVLVFTKIRLYQYAANPYTDVDYQRFEAAVRRNHAVRSALMVREFFTFGKGSELIFYMPDEDTQGFDKEKVETEQQNRINANAEYKQAMQKIEQFDKDVKFEEHWKTLWWHGVTYGRSVMVKIHPDWVSQKITRLMNIHPRRISYPILDIANDLSFEGVYIDGQPLDKSAMIYAQYQNRQISPHTDHFGYSIIEPIAHMAETLNIMMEEDLKEISKTAWLKSFLLTFDTAGMTDSDAQSNMQAVLDNIKPGIFTAISQSLTATPLDFSPDLEGLDTMAAGLETRIFKELQVPEFLVQSEKAANRATASQSASLFLNGVVAEDQRWLMDTTEEQYYEPLLRYFLDGEKDEGEYQEKDPQTGRYVKPLLLKVKRVLNVAKVAEFVDLAASVALLKSSGIWDVQKCNEVLGTEEVTQRIQQAQDEMNKQMEQENNQKGDETNELQQPGKKPDTPAGKKTDDPTQQTSMPKNRAAKEQNNSTPKPQAPQK